MAERLPELQKLTNVIKEMDNRGKLKPLFQSYGEVLGDLFQLLEKGYKLIKNDKYDEVQSHESIKFLLKTLKNPPDNFESNKDSIMEDVILTLEYLLKRDKIYRKMIRDVSDLQELIEAPHK